MKTGRTALFAAALAASALCGASAQARELPRFGPSVQAESPLPSFGPPVAAEYPTAADGSLQFYAEHPPRHLTEGAEVVVVTGYEPTEAERRGAGARIAIDRPGKKVALVLASYENVHWRVTATPGTRLAGILASGHHRPTVLVEAADEAVPVFLTKIPYVYKAENLPAMRAALARAYGIEHIDVFRASYAIPPEIVINQLDPPRTTPAPPGEPRTEEPKTNFTFRLLTQDFQEETWTLAGRGGAEQEVASPDRPQKKYWRNRREVLSPDKKRLYTVEPNRMLIRELRDGGERVAPLPAAFPELRDPGGMAYDSKRNLLVLTSGSARGYLYRFDPVKEEWLDFHHNPELRTDSLTYDPIADRYVGVEANPVATNSLIFISPEGEHLFTRKLAPLKNGAYSVVFLSILQILPHGDDIALVDIDPLREVVRAVWHYNVKTDKTALTYYRPEKD